MNLTLVEKWKASWKIALENWSKFTKLREPIFLRNTKEKKTLGIDPQLFAMIRLTDHSIFIDLKKIEALGLENYPLEILGHEIGHHIAYPGSITELGKMLVRIQKALDLSNLTFYATFVGNIYTDLLINHKLFLEFNYRMYEIYQKLQTQVKEVDSFWLFYMRIYEILWALPKGSLAQGKISGEMEADAELANRIVRNYAVDWLKGAGEFAILCIPYLMPEQRSAIQTQKILSTWLDAKSVNDKNFKKFPVELMETDEDEEEVMHPSLDPVLNDSILEDKEKKKNSDKIEKKSKKFRDPSQFNRILKDMGLSISQSDLVYNYYKQRALPYLIPFIHKKIPNSSEPILEGFDIWEVSSPLENINWFQTALKSPVVIPGYTTLEDYFGTETGQEPKTEPVDLDLYVDCSGSMPNPATEISYLALAGTIVLLSALRAGAKVQATLWSGKGQFKTTNGFIDDEKKLMEIVTGYIGGATAFPLNLLEETYANRKPTDKKVHILVISDEGIDTLHTEKFKGKSGKEISSMVVTKAGGGATMALNLYYNLKSYPKILEMQKQGWDIHVVKTWEDLIKFAFEFSKKNYSQNL